MSSLTALCSEKIFDMISIFLNLPRLDLWPKIWSLLENVHEHLRRKSVFCERAASQAGECWSAPILCAGISLLCPLHPCCYTLLHGSETLPSAHPLFIPCPCQWRGFLVCGNFSSFTAPSQRCRSRPYSFVSVFSFFFCPTQVRGVFLAFWEVWGLLPVFSWCSVRVVPHVDVFLMYLWGGRWSPCLTLQPSWRPFVSDCGFDLHFPND